VVDQVGGLVEEKLVILVFGLNHQFHGLLSHLLGNFVDALLKQ
jgi:hypothetical protein